MSIAVFVISVTTSSLGHKIAPKYLVQVGIIIMAVGAFLIRNVISMQVTNMDLLPGFVIFGIGVGLMLAQLTNITLSAVKDRERGEASGVSETAKGLGTSLGTAIIGSVLVVALLSGLVSGVQQSDVLDDSLKEEISKGLKDNTMHMKEEDIEKELHKLPKDKLSS